MAATGILGGSFNPPHRGHLALAQAALSQLGLERVLLVPAGQAPHKQIEDDPGSEVRLDLCRAAVAGLPGLGVSAIEVERPGPSYTVETLENLKREHPDRDLVLILGQDMAESLGSWRDPRRVVELARIAWTGRPGGSEGAQGGSDRVDSLVRDLGGAEPLYLALEPMPVSSTLVRQLSASGESIEELVTGPVARLIAERGLYGAGVAR